jgi:VanZ family protein
VLKQLFSIHSPYIKQAKFCAICWTLLILFACFIPGNEVPNVRIPLIDKWVHFVLFAVFTFLWLLVKPSANFTYLVLITVIGCLLGWFVEEIQGALHFLGRSKDWNDIYADAIGAVLGSLLFYICTLKFRKNDSIQVD